MKLIIIDKEIRLLLEEVRKIPGKWCKFRDCGNGKSFCSGDIGLTITDRKEFKHRIGTLSCSSVNSFPTREATKSDILLACARAKDEEVRDYLKKYLKEN